MDIAVLLRDVNSPALCACAAVAIRPSDITVCLRKRPRKLYSHTKPQAIHPFTNACICISKRSAYFYTFNTFFVSFADTRRLHLDLSSLYIHPYVCWSESFLNGRCWTKCCKLFVCGHLVKFVLTLCDINRQYKNKKTLNLVIYTVTNKLTYKVANILVLLMGFDFVGRAKRKVEGETG